VSEKKEYIERGALLKQFDEALLTGMAQRAHASGVSEEAIKAALDKTRVVSEIVVQCINAIPAADVEPVVRGEWIERSDHMECSVCATPVGFSDANDRCPCCYAHMMAHMERSGSGE